MASGNWAPKSFSRFWRRNQTQTMGRAPRASPAAARQRRVLPEDVSRRAAGQRQDRRGDRQPAGRQRDVGLLEEQIQVEVAEAFQEGVQQGGALVQRPGKDAGLLHQAVLGGRRRVGPGEQVEAVLDAAGRLLRQERRRPADDGEDSNERDDRKEERIALNPPSSPAGGRRWRAAARRPSPAAA